MRRFFRPTLRRPLRFFMRHSLSAGENDYCIEPARRRQPGAKRSREDSTAEEHAVGVLRWQNADGRFDQFLGAYFTSVFFLVFFSNWSRRFSIRSSR